MLTLIIPTYRERDNIAPLLARLEAVRGRIGEPLEVLMVDNYSEDGTAARARAVLHAYRLGRVIQPLQRCGLAEAVSHGIQEAAGELLGVMDADLSHPPELLPALVEAVRAGHELAIASRYVRGGGVERWPLERRLLSRLGNLAAWPLTSVHDATSGYFLGQAHVLKSVPIQATGFKVLLELLVNGRLTRVIEVPYVFRDRQHGSSKLDGRVLGQFAGQLGRLAFSRCVPAPSR